jgi:hypothetical protein
MSRMENCRDTSVAALANGSTDSGRPSLDRRAMDALVNAVEARLREHGAQVDRRLADLEASLALEIDSLRQQEHALSGRAETVLESAHKQWNEQMLALWQQRKEDMTALRREFTDFQRQFVTDIAGTIENQVAFRIEAAVPGLLAARLEPLASEMDLRGREIAALRQRLAEGDRNLLEIVLGMGEWFRELAARMCNSKLSDSQLPPASGPQP